VAKIGNEVYGNLTEEKIKELVQSCRDGTLASSPQINTLISEYEKNGGFTALKKAVASSPEEIIAEVKKAKLLGRGGAAYPSGSKWEHLLHIEETPKYIVCNADEGEPGTFKDKFILENMPFRLIEGIIIAGVVFQAKAGYIYVRGEYRKIQKQLLAAIESVRAAGYLSKEKIGIDYDIYIVSGAGAYVCGENSALLNSTEGKVGRPRIKPPHLAEVGLFLQPTLVNNVESLATIPVIINMGGDAYLQSGHPDSGGSKLVCLSGHVKNRNVFDIPLGKHTIREIIYNDEFGGGVTGGKTLKFFHLGGQSGPIGGIDQLDAVYSYTDLIKSRLSVGSGAIVVMDDSVSILEYLIGVTEFFIHESCGKCVPCREGNRQILAILKKLTVPEEAGAEDLAVLKQLVHTMTSASFCGLGQTSAAALNSAWKIFKEEFEQNARKS
jgi:NADH-quinone oxidoreductase subunit F